MTDSTNTAAEETKIEAEPLWMVTRPGGDIMIRWEDMTLEEQIAAHRHHNRMYGIEDSEVPTP